MAAMLWSTRLARTTMASAFQRIRLLILRSISWSPGNTPCLSAGIVFTYGVFAVNAGPIPSVCAPCAEAVEQERRGFRALFF